MKSSVMSSPRACGRADKTQASMINAKKNFFIIVRKGLRSLRLYCSAIYSTCHSKSVFASRVFGIVRGERLAIYEPLSSRAGGSALIEGSEGNKDWS